MRIEGSSPWNVLNAPAVERDLSLPQAAPDVEEGANTDEAHISSDAAFVSTLLTQIAAMPDSRPDRVATLRDAIQSGTYRVSGEQIASSLCRDPQWSVR